jgi:uncharacterized protein DUF2846
MRRIVATFWLIGVAACASVPKADPVLVASARSFAPTGGHARIYVMRTKSLVLAAITQPVVVDGLMIGATGPGTFLMTEVEPGPHTVSVTGQGNAKAQQIQAEDGHCYFVKIWMRTGLVGTVGLELVNEDEGRDLVQRYRMAAPTQGR